MPELPEVETVVRQLNAALKGKTFAKVEVFRDKSAQSDLHELVGRKVEHVGRMAKYLVFTFEGWKKYLLVHLKMTGQLVYIPNKQKSKNSKYQKKQDINELKQRVVGGHPTEDWVGKLPSKHTRIVVGFTDGSKLFFNDQRVFGWWKVADQKDLDLLRKRLPPDVVDEGFTFSYLHTVLQRSSRAVKLVILDQQKMGGMGNIYANDALWLAKILPTRKANGLTAQEIKRLHRAMVEVLNKGIALGGASYSHFVHADGMGGAYQEHFLVYDREGEKCLRDDGGVIEKIKVGGRGTYLCKVCQV